jgi:regulator of sirC expression with transglutaminase-like and TPR domain
MVNKGEIKAMIRLLDDPDDSIYSEVKSRLIRFGPDVMPELESSWNSSSMDLLMQERIEEIMFEIHHQGIYEQLRQWKNTIGHPLLEASLILARFEYPHLDDQEVRNQMERIRRDVWLEFNDHLTALEQIKVINHILFDVHGFAPNRQDYHAPQNSYLNEVLDVRKGNPLTIGLIYLYVTQGLTLPVYGVNLPNHFVLCYCDNSIDADTNNPGSNVLFYINPFSKGTVFNHLEIEHFLNQYNLPHDPEFFAPCTHLHIIKRAVRNLINSYQKNGRISKIQPLKEMLKILEE